MSKPANTSGVELNRKHSQASAYVYRGRKEPAVMTLVDFEFGGLDA